MAARVRSFLGFRASRGCDNGRALFCLDLQVRNAYSGIWDGASISFRSQISRMKKAQTVSVIMNCLDCTRYLREAVDSVYAQSYPNWEIILWDNCSTENVKAALAGFDDRLRYFRGTRTVPLGEARNLAMTQAGGELIAFLDCDDMWLPNKLDRQLRCFGDAEVGLSYTDWTLFNDRGYQRVRFGDAAGPDGWVFEKVLFDNFTCLSTLLIRAKLVNQHGIIFDPQFTYIEDTDFIIRVARDWKFAYVPEQLTKYRMHSESASATRVPGFRDEEERLLEKHCKVFPEFAEKYERRIRARISKDRATDQWRQGNRRLARRVLRAELLQNWRYPLIYLALFLPFPLVNWLRMRVSRRATGYYY
jgi:glycosyltransferase involved in cell wall biosynthesis